MDENVEALCTDEVEHLLLDADKKVRKEFIKSNFSDCIAIVFFCVDRCGVHFKQLEHFVHGK